MIDFETDWNFDLRARQPRHAEYKTSWLEKSKATRFQLEGSIDITCGNHTDMTFDIFPAGQSMSPCFVFLHGGFWRSSDKSESSFVANAFANFGITTVIMNYRLAPAVSIAEIVMELQKSVVSLFKRSSQFGIDRDRIVIGGFSAGGLLAAHVLGTNWTKHGVSRPVISKGMALSGIFDPEPLIWTRHNQLLELSIEQAQALNVINNTEITPKLALVGCGNEETPGFREQTSRYINAARENGHDIQELWINDRHHYDVVLEFADPKSSLATATRNLILC